MNNNVALETLWLLYARFIVLLLLINKMSNGKTQQKLSIANYLYRWYELWNKKFIINI